MKNLVFVPVDKAAETLKRLGKDNQHVAVYSEMFD